MLITTKSIYKKGYEIVIKENTIQLISCRLSYLNYGNGKKFEHIMTHYVEKRFHFTAGQEFQS